MMTTEYNELGAVHIADKVIAGIAVEAALAVKGVVGPAASFGGKIRPFFFASRHRYQNGRDYG